MSFATPPSPPPPPKPQGTGCFRIFLILCGLFGVMLAICCGIGGYIFSVQPTAKEVLAKVTDIEVPKTLESFFAFDLAWLGKEQGVRFAILRQEKRPAMLLTVVEVMLPESPDMMEAGSKRVASIGDRIQMKEVGSFEREIRGHTAKFIVGTAVADEGRTELNGVRGAFRSKSGVAEITIVMPEKDFDGELVRRIIDSIK